MLCKRPLLSKSTTCGSMMCLLPPIHGIITSKHHLTLPHVELLTLSSGPNPICLRPCIECIGCILDRACPYHIRNQFLSRNHLRLYGKQYLPTYSAHSRISCLHIHSLASLSLAILYRLFACHPYCRRSRGTELSLNTHLAPYIWGIRECHSRPDHQWKSSSSPECV